MKESKFSEEQIAYVLRQVEGGAAVPDVCRQMGVSEATFYIWKKKYAHLGVRELRQMRALEDENARLGMAFARRDHKVELVVSYPKSPPSAVWRLLTEHASEPTWLPAFGTVVRQADIAGHEVWMHTSPDRSFSATVMTVSVVPEQRYERLLLRDGQPPDQSWDGHWIYELEPLGGGTRLRITEYGWTDGFPFFVQQRVLADPDAFLKYYAQMIGRQLNDPPEIQVLRSH